MEMAADEVEADAAPMNNQHGFHLLLNYYDFEGNVHAVWDNVHGVRDGANFIIESILNSVENGLSELRVREASGQQPGVSLLISSVRKVYLI